MKRQRHERLKAAGHVLKLPQLQQMVDAMLDAFDMPVKHRGVRFQPQPVGGAMHREPRPGVGLAGADSRADFGVENFRPAARHAPHARRDHLFQHRFHRPLRDFREPIDLDGRPRLQMQPRKRGVQFADDLQVPFVRFLGMRAADDVHFGAARSRSLPGRARESRRCSARKHADRRRRGCRRTGRSDRSRRSSDSDAR